MPRATRAAPKRRPAASSGRAEDSDDPLALSPVKPVKRTRNTQRVGVVLRAGLRSTVAVPARSLDDVDAREGDLVPPSDEDELEEWRAGMASQSTGTNSQLDKGKRKMIEAEHDTVCAPFDHDRQLSYASLQSDTALLPLQYILLTYPLRQQRICPAVHPLLSPLITVWTSPTPMRQCEAKRNRLKQDLVQARALSSQKGNTSDPDGSINSYSPHHLRSHLLVPDKERSKRRFGLISHSGLHPQSGIRLRPQGDHGLTRR
jgi:hypothetical protein